ncbi:hypothetical protein Tco_0644786 [Tanacetum coccineum]
MRSVSNRWDGDDMEVRKSERKELICVFLDMGQRMRLSSSTVTEKGRVLSTLAMSDYTVKPKLSQQRQLCLSPKIKQKITFHEDWTSDDEEEVSEVQKVRHENQTVKSRDDKSGQNSHKQGVGFRKVKACFVCRSTEHLIKDCLFMATSLHYQGFRIMMLWGQEAVSVNLRGYKGQNAVDILYIKDVHMCSQWAGMIWLLESVCHTKLTGDISIRSVNALNFLDEVIKQLGYLCRAPRKGMEVYSLRLMNIVPSGIPWANLMENLMKDICLDTLPLVTPMILTVVGLRIPRYQRVRGHATDKEEQHQMQDNEKDLQDELEMLVTQELVAKCVSKAQSNTLTVSTATGANANGSSFVYLGGKIPIDASTLPIA